MPLYLEWAPENSLREPKIVNSGESKEKLDNNKQDVEERNTKLENEENNDEEQDEEEEPEPDTTLFVKNLNFITTDDGLRQVSEMYNSYFLTAEKFIQNLKILSNISCFQTG